MIWPFFLWGFELYYSECVYGALRQDALPFDDIGGCLGRHPEVGVIGLRLAISMLGCLFWDGMK